MILYGRPARQAHTVSFAWNLSMALYVAQEPHDRKFDDWQVVLSGGHTTLKLFSAVGFKNFNIIHPPLEVKIDTKARPHGLKVNCDAVMIHATD